MSIILISIALSSILITRSVGSGVEVLSILILIFAMYKRKINFPQSTSFKIGSYLTLGILIVSLVNILILDKGHLGNLSILRHYVYPICVAGIIFYKEILNKSFQEIVDIVIKSFGVGLLIVTAYHLFLIIKDPSLITKGTRLRGFTGINHLAYCVSGFFPFVFSSFLNRLKTKGLFKSKSSIIEVFTLIAMAFAIYLTKSRGPLLAILLFTPACIFFFYKKFFYYSSAITLLVCLIAGSFLLSDKNSNSRFLLPLNTKSNLQRLVQYKVAIDLIKDHPFVGVGLKQYGKRSVIKKEEMGYEYADFKSHAHNTFLHVMSEVGLIFGGLFLFFYPYLIFESAKFTQCALSKSIFVNSFGVFIFQSLVDHVFQIQFAVLTSSIVGLYWIYLKSIGMSKNKAAI